MISFHILALKLSIIYDSKSNIRFEMVKNFISSKRQAQIFHQKEYAIFFLLTSNILKITKWSREKFIYEEVRPLRRLLDIFKDRRKKLKKRRRVRHRSLKSLLRLIIIE